MADAFQERVRAVLAERYALVRELGSGGMAIVYLADDLRHKRKVAVKVLRPELASAIGVERFQREIETAAGLAHPHIVPVHDSGAGDGLLWYTMPFIEGESLRARLLRKGALPVDEALRITREVGEALTWAHARGVIHRDIKPENILLTAGAALVSDFGIARIMEQADDLRLTATGASMGTPYYMSPEQAAGDRGLDARADLYSLGCVAFELLTGHPPYTGATAMEIVIRHTNDPIPSLRAARPESPAALDTALQRALAKRPEDRFASVQEFLDVLAGADVPASRRWSPGARRLVAGVAVVLLGTVVWVLAGRPGLRGEARARYTVAVLPCANLSGDPSQEYFGEGVTEQIIAQLSSAAELRVISIYSVLPYRATAKSASQIGQELGAHMLVRCSASRSAEGVRVSAQLVDVGRDAAIWADDYRRDAGAVFAIQHDAAVEIAGALAATLYPTRRGRAVAPTNDAVAFDLYQHGRYFWNRGSIDGLMRALQYYQQAIARDSGFALAWAGLADAEVSLVGRWFLPAHEHFRLARAAVDRALAADSGLGEAYAVLGRIRHRYDWDWEGAERAFLTSQALTPGASRARMDHARLQSSLGRHEEAITEAREAVALDPLSPINILGLSQVLFFARRYDQALVQVDRSIELDSMYALPYLWRALVLTAAGRPDEARSAGLRAALLTRRHPSSLATLGYVEARAGRRAAAESLLAELRSREATTGPAPMLEAAIFIGLRDADSAFAWLERAREARDWQLADLAVHPLADPLRSDPRFGALLASLGLDGVARRTGGR